MSDFISYEKLSKKARRQLDQRQRQTWGSLKPVTRKKNSAKLYDRKKARLEKDDFPLSGLFCCLYIISYT